MMNRKITAIILLSALVSPLVSRAADFDPDFVVSDAEATETSSFTADGIQAFLSAQNSALSVLSFVDQDGVTKRAADIIENASLENRVSPRFMLALLQREQSLITEQTPTQTQLDWATGYGVCDSCSMSDPALQKFRGFANQVHGAAGNFRYFMDNGKNMSGFRKAGQKATIDGIEIVPVTSATANLYNYTPHLNAQQNFWNIWQRYFVRRYPSGSIVTASPAIPGYWLIRYGQRQKISSYEVLLSRYDPKKILSVGANDLLAYPLGADIKFPNYSLLRSPKGNVYLLVDDQKRGIVSREVFRQLGFSWSEVEDASWDDLASYRDGANITLASVYPFGALLRNPANGGVFFVQNGVKRPIVSPEILTLYFANRKVKKSSVAELDKLATADPIALADGELVKTADNSAIYVISDGQRLPITSASEFEKQGWKWENVKVVSGRVLALSPLGDVFNPEASSLQISNN